MDLGRKYAATLTGISLFAAGAWIFDRLAPESAPVARGEAYAGIRGCVACHGDPADSLPDSNDVRCSDVNPFSWHPDYETDCADAMAYFEAIRLLRTLDERMSAGPEDPLVKGEALARKYHCFQCHGQLGQGGFANAGSLKGYVPGYFGSDFKVLTENADSESVRSWIVNGMDFDIVKQPVTGRIAEFFLDRQAVSMPSFKSLQEEEIDTLVSYVIVLNGFGPMTANTIRSYGELTGADLKSGEKR